jgi:hypothetical protein
LKTDSTCSFRWFAALVAAGLMLTMAGCRRGCDGPTGRTAGAGALALLPAETRIVVALDFRKIRGSPLWRQLAALAADDPEDRKIIDELTARTGLDPFRDVHRLIAGFPDDARQAGAFALIFEGEPFDEKRLLTYARDQARLRGRTIEQRPHGKRMLWTGAGDPELSGFFLDRHRFVLGGGGWTQKVADLADGASQASASRDATLVRLVERTGAARAMWLAAIVPEATRERLMADPRFGVQASVMRLGAGADLAPGLTGELVAELSNQDDAQALVGRIDEFLTAAKRSPKALLLGAGPYLDGIRAQAEGPTARIRIGIDEAQTGELVRRLQALKKGAGAAGGRPPSR